jgi:hypothetical protein
MRRLASIPWGVEGYPPPGAAQVSGTTQLRPTYFLGPGGIERGGRCVVEVSHPPGVSGFRLLLRVGSSLCPVRLHAIALDLPRRRALGGRLLSFGDRRLGCFHALAALFLGPVGPHPLALSLLFSFRSRPPSSFRCSSLHYSRSGSRPTRHLRFQSINLGLQRRFPRHQSFHRPFENPRIHLHLPREICGNSYGQLSLRQLLGISNGIQ